MRWGGSPHPLHSVTPDPTQDTFVLSRVAFLDSVNIATGTFHEAQRGE